MFCLVIVIIFSAGKQFRREILLIMFSFYVDIGKGDINPVLRGMSVFLKNVCLWVGSIDPSYGKCTFVASNIGGILNPLENNL